jgi:hypothetical protein
MHKKDLASESTLSYNAAEEPSMCSKTFLASIVYGLLAFVPQSMFAASSTPSLAGSWQFTLTPTTSSGTAVSYPGLATFTTNGSVVETDGTEYASIPVTSGAPPKAATSGHGVWGPDNTPLALLVQYISLVVNADGSLYAKRMTTMVLTVSSTGETFSGTYATNQVVGGSTTVISSGTVSGTLIPQLIVPVNGQ